MRGVFFFRKQMIQDRLLLPQNEDQLEVLADVGIFSVIDLKNGVFHVQMHEDSFKFTAIVTLNFTRFINAVIRKYRFVT